MKTKALIRLQGRPEEALVLKRLALLFDEIHYVQPQAYSLTQEALADPEIVEKTDDGKFIIKEEFNFFRDVDLEWSRLLTLSEDERLTSVLEPFVDAGIAVSTTWALSVHRPATMF